MCRRPPGKGPAFLEAQGLEGAGTSVGCLRGHGPPAELPAHIQTKSSVRAIWLMATLDASVYHLSNALSVFPAVACFLDISGFYC